MAEKTPAAPLKLSAELEGKYELTDTHAGPAIVHTVVKKEGREVQVPHTVDFRTMTAAQADALIAGGCKSIKKVEGKGAPKV